MSAHQPILVQTIVDLLLEDVEKRFPSFSEDRPPCFVDFTFGGGGHTALLLLRLSEKLKNYQVLGIDQDPQAIEAAQLQFKDEIKSKNLELHCMKMGESEKVLKEKNILGAIADLGFSSDQIENPQRGLSFLKEGPLDMRLNPTRGQTCLDLLRIFQEKELADLIFHLGEERFSRRIAKAIVLAKNHQNLPQTTRQLAELITRAVPSAYRRGRIHPATRNFQALRIAVNDELGELDKLLNHVILFVKPRGRVAILSFHSLEDRMVKNAFRGKNGAGFFRSLTKKPILPDQNEIQTNPRSRSAKLRVAERVS